MIIRGEFRIDGSTAANGGGNESGGGFQRDDRYNRRSVICAFGEEMAYGDGDYGDRDFGDSDCQGDHHLSQVNFAENDNNYILSR